MEDGSKNNVNGGSKQETEDEGVTVTVVSVEDPPESKVVAVEWVSQSESSSDEESKPIENHPEGEVGESVGFSTYLLIVISAVSKCAFSFSFSFFLFFFSFCQDTPVVSVLPPVRPSLWMGCCGLFELLRGSNR